jgi:flagellar motor switch protein FliN/FliY
MSNSDLLNDSVDPARLEALLHDVPLDVSIELGRARMNLGELAARLGPGSIIPLDKATGAPLDVRINDRLVARAEAVAVGERCGIRIIEIVTGKDR